MRRILASLIIIVSVGLVAGCCTDEFSCGAVPSYVAVPAYNTCSTCGNTCSSCGQVCNSCGTNASYTSYTYGGLYY